MKIRDRIKELKRVPAGDLLPNPKNWRTHPAAQADALRGVLGEVGFADAVLARETEGGLMLIDGHLRAEVAPDASVPVLVLDVTQEEADKILATHDPLAAMATTDAGQLADLLDGMRFDSDAATAMTESLAKAEGVEQSAEVVEDEVPEPPADPVTQPGDLIKMGEHRVLCSDSTKGDSVRSFVGDLSVDLIVTDPPYGVAYQTALSTHEAAARNRRKDGLEVANDDLGWDGTKQLVHDSISNAPLKKGGVFYVFCPPGHLQAAFYLGLKEADLVARHQLVWVKDRFVMGRCDYHYKHEVILYGWSEGAAHYFVDDRTQDSVWEHKRPGTSKEHPTMKPLGLIARAIKNSSKKGEVIYDPFLGSGSTLIAAEQLGRTCYGLEISPAYCDVIVNRWESLTGRKAERNGARTDSQTNEAENTGRRKERRPDKPKRTRSTKRQAAGT